MSFPLRRPPSTDAGTSFLQGFQQDLKQTDMALLWKYVTEHYFKYANADVLLVVRLKPYTHL